MKIFSRNLGIMAWPYKEGTKKLDRMELAIKMSARSGRTIKDCMKTKSRKQKGEERTEVKERRNKKERKK